MTKMVRWFAVLGILIFTRMFAATPIVEEVYIKENGALVITAEYQGHSLSPIFELLTAESVSAPRDSWIKIPFNSLISLSDSKWLIELSFPETNIAFYRITVTEDKLPTVDSGIILSEICSANVSLLADIDGDFSDWIELYNSGDTTVSLQGWTLSDNINEPDKWTIPNVSLKPGELSVIFASGKDRRDFGRNFTLHSKSAPNGEALLLSNAQGQVMDAIRLGRLDDDSTLGRSRSIGSDWFQFQQASNDSRKNQ
jgi:hypothetical protein